jgi:hypothetical protein
MNKRTRIASDILLIMLGLVIGWAITKAIYEMKPCSDTYFIKKGNHYSRHERTELFLQSRYSFAFKFDHTAMYDFANDNQEDWNKLTGFRYATIQKNSARFVWRWNPEDKVVDIGAYAYVDGERFMQQIGQANIDEVYAGMIINNENEYLFIYGGNIIQVPKTVWNEKKFWQYPYFGGDERAPHDIKIELWND